MMGEARTCAGEGDGTDSAEGCWWWMDWSRVLGGDAGCKLTYIH